MVDIIKGILGLSLKAGANYKIAICKIDGETRTPRQLFARKLVYG